MASANTKYSILVISDYRPVGSARPEAEIFICLAQLGHTVHILSYPEATWYNERFRSAGIRVIEQHPRRKLSWSGIRLIRKETMTNRYDIVHAFNTQALVHAVWALIGLPAKLIAYRGYAGQTHWYDPAMYSKYFHPRVDHIICVSRDIEKIVAQNWIGGKNKLSTIPKGHDPYWYTGIVPVERERLGFAANDILLAFVANVRPFKGLTYLLQATHLLDPALPVRILFIGRGYDDPAIQKEIAKSPLNAKMHVLGYQRDPLAIVAACDVLVQTSTHGEGLSKSVVEAMSLGIAPVITEIPGNEGLVIDGESGWVVPPKDPQALAAALQSMIQHPEQRSLRGQRAKEHIQRHFHIDHTVKAFVALYAQLLKVHRK